MIYLLRHGQTEFNREGRLQGRLDSPLTALGQDQARRMGRVLRQVIERPEAWTMVASPLGRTRHTAELVREAAGLDCRIEIDDRLAELDVGQWEGLNRQEILACAPHVDFAPGWMFDAPGGEGAHGMSARLAAWLAEHDESDGRRRIVVSHGVAGRMLRHLYCGVATDHSSPPQDSVFLLHQGVVGRIDEGLD